MSPPTTLPTPTTINDLPDVILSLIIAAISSPRSRNSASLVCQKWCHLERSTRSSIAVRGNLRDLFMMPTSFSSISDLDISLLSPWGHALTSASDPELTAHLLRLAFPSVTSLTFYARNISTIQLILSQWENINHLKLVRWHQRPHVENNPGDELQIVFAACQKLNSLDLSSFYCWTEDVPPALQSNSAVALNLTRINMLNPSFSEGFKSEEIRVITRACPNLIDFRAACMFDPRYIGFVGDEALLSISTNCPRIEVLHLADTAALLNVRGDAEDQGFTQEDARINVATLIEVFSGLPLLEDLVLDLCNNVRDSGPALEVLHLRCPRLRSLKLGQFHGVSLPVESKLDGVAVCQRLESLSIRNVGDLTDMGLIGIGRGCCRLNKFEIIGCKDVTMRGMRTFASLLHKTLIDVKISCCKNLGTSSSLRALEPLQNRIERLHIDCVWESPEELEDLDGVGGSFDLNCSNQSEVSLNSTSYDYDEMNNANKRCKYSYDLNSGYNGIDLNSGCNGFDLNGNGHENGNGFDLNGNGHENGNGFDLNGDGHENGNGFDLNGSGYENGNGFDLNGSGYENGFGFDERTWERLQYLSLWIAVGQHLTPLETSGLESCPNLEEIRIKVEGDCRELPKPSKCEFGLSVLAKYPRLTKMHLDCAETIGYAHTAPFGQMDLSTWERFTLLGIGHLNLKELDYWPPQDRDVNQRSLSLPAAGLLQGCVSIRKLIIHGTAHEHFMMFFLKIPNIRDVQLREDYYPAPENDMSTEMRSDSCSRFEAALNRRVISD